MAEPIEMCSYYNTTGFPYFKPLCLKGLKASLRCHTKNSCPEYKQFELKEEANRTIRFEAQ